MGLGLAVLRAIVGLLFVGHGAQRLFGWFGGGGPEGTGQFFESVGVRPGKQNAVASGISETAGGALLALGLAIPLASAALSGDHGDRALDGAEGQRTVGHRRWLRVQPHAPGRALRAGRPRPGKWSLDEALSLDRSGPGWTLAQLAAAVAGTAAVLKRAESQPGA